jgi:Tripartite tricarboxylate transporter TctB family
LNLRRDHVAGGAFLLASGVVAVLSRDLPFGTLASPGAGMLPLLLLGLLAAFSMVLFVRAGESPLLATIAWTDFAHAARVAAIAAAAIALYEGAGFLITLTTLLFVLTFIVERKPLLPSLAFSIGVTGFAYALFGLLLKTPLPRGPLGF